jgi:hypothetical protein
MPRESATRIEYWFRSHNGGEFCSSERWGYTIVPPPSSAGAIIWTTKEHSVEPAICNAPESANLEMVARYGLPRSADVSHLLNFVGSQRLMFLGDMDPDDLLVFSWLRENLSPKPIEYLGVGEKFLADRRVEIPDSFRIRLSDSEIESLKLLKTVSPDYRALIGDRCAMLLDDGYGIEIEAVVSSLGTVTPLLP